MINLRDLDSLNGALVVGFDEIKINGVSSIFDPRENSLTWINPTRGVSSNIFYKLKCVCVLIDHLPNEIDVAFLQAQRICLVVVSDPKAVFSSCMRDLEMYGLLRLGKWFNHDRSLGIHIHQSSTILCEIDSSKVKNLWVGPYAFIGECVTLGDNVKIGPGAIIGGDGFGFNVDAHGNTQRMPHIGGVIIEDFVEIGANSTIDRGTIGSTRLKSHSKIDNLVHIAHNVEIGRNSHVVAHSTVCGSCCIGDNTWIGANAIIREALTVGHGVTVGLGSAVVKSIPDNEVWAGVPAKKIK